jgi:hypothetical protein
MTDLRLILKFKIKGEAAWRVKEAARISVKGGRLTLFGRHARAFEAIPLSRIEALLIQYVSGVPQEGVGPLTTLRCEPVPAPLSSVVSSK